MKILLFDPDSGHGITQASIYLRDYLNKYHDVDMISWNDLNIEKDKYDLFLVHDSPIDVSKVKIKTAYFSPGVYPYNDRIENLKFYDYIISPDPEFASVIWTFNIPIPEKIQSFHKRDNSAFYAGRISNWKLCPYFVATFMKNNNTITVAGDKQEEDELDKILIDLIENSNRSSYLGKLDHGETLIEMNKHKFYLLISYTDIFSLSALESVYQGCLPIVRRREFNYPWMVNETPSGLDSSQCIDIYEKFKKINEDDLSKFTSIHREKVIEKMTQLSNINVFNQVFDS